AYPLDTDKLSLLGGFARQRGNPQRRDAIALPPQDLEAKAVKSEALPGLGNRSGLMDDETRDGGGFLIRQLPVHGAVEVPDRHVAVDAHRTVGLRPDAGHDDVVFVADVADDLLEDIFERGEAHDLAVFVDHERERRLAPPEGAQLIQQRTDIGHEPRRPGDRLHVDLRYVSAVILRGAQQILGMQDADDVFRLAAPQRDSRDRLGQDFLDDLFRRP